MDKLRVPKQITYKWEQVTELPNSVGENTIYIVGENGFKWYLAMKCPCNCGDVIYLNLLKERYPCWKMKLKNGLISINPSVWRTQKCKSHFVINKGNIIWFHSNGYFAEQ